MAQRTTRSAAVSDRLPGTVVESTDLKVALGAAVDEAVRHIGGRTTNAAPDMTEEMTRIFHEAHPQASQTWDQNTHHLHANMSHDDEAGFIRRCVIQDVGTGDQSNIPTVLQAAIIIGADMKPKLVEPFTGDHISMVGCSLMQVGKATDGAIAQCSAILGGDSVNSLQIGLKKSVGSQSLAIHRSLDDDTCTREVFCNYSGLNQNGHPTFFFRANNGDEHTDEPGGSIAATVPIYREIGKDWDVESPEMDCAAPLPSKGMSEWQSNTNFFAYKLDKGVDSALSKFEGLSDPGVARSLKTEFTNRMPDLCRRLNVSTNEPNEVECRVVDAISKNGDHEAIFTLQNTVEDPDAKHLTWVSMRASPMENGWATAIDVSTAGYEPNLRSGTQQETTGSSTLG